MAALTCAHDLCFEQSKNNNIFSSENYHFDSREKLLYIEWACFRNGKVMF